MRKKPTLVIFKRIGSKQNWKCNVCSQALESTAQVDHIIPLGNGGSNDEENLQILCVSCHAKKTQEESMKRFYKRSFHGADLFKLFRYKCDNILDPLGSFFHNK